MKTAYSYGVMIIVMVQLIFIITAPLRAFSQTVDPAKGSLSMLDSANGYGDLVLGADTRQMPGKNFAFLDNDKNIDPDSCLKFKYTDISLLDFEDDIKLDLVGLRSYNNRIVNIYLFFKAEDGFKMLRIFRKYFGNPTRHPADFMYDWTGSEVSLQLRFQNKGDLGLAVFSSNEITQQVAAARIARKQLDANSMMAASSGSKTGQNPGKKRNYADLLVTARTNP